MEAALYPAESDYLYFVVSGTEGRHKFSRNSSEHDQAVEEYRRQQRELREQQQNGKQ
ncbi:MAG TPA: endolytic transglycosylase MltG [Blastocatellia bacterium]|nr:endolytic transglycosylase MltG [Blastocatellia bacterium]